MGAVYMMAALPLRTCSQSLAHELYGVRPGVDPEESIVHQWLAFHVGMAKLCGRGLIRLRIFDTISHHPQQPRLHLGALAYNTSNERGPDRDGVFQYLPREETCAHRGLLCDPAFPRLDPDYRCFVDGDNSQAVT